MIRVRNCLLEIAQTYCKKYRLPDPVFMRPPFTPLRTGDVVISVPLRKPLELLILPEIEPSGFCFHWEITGTPAGALLTAVLEEDPPPKKEKADLASVLDASAILIVPPLLGTFASGFFKGAANKLKLFDRGAACSFFGLGAACFLLIGFEPNRLKLWDGFTAFVPCFC